jgi:hypothetical protein
MPGAALQEPASGWPIAAAVMGFVAAAPVLGLGVAAGMNTSDKWLSIGLGIASLSTMLIFGPISSTGQSSARRGTPVWGGLGARIPAWILFGVVAIEGVTMIALGATDHDIPEGLIYSAAALGATSLILFGIDSLVSRASAHEWYEEQLAARRLGWSVPGFEQEDGPRLVFQPRIAPVLGLRGEGLTGASLGLAGAF